MKMIPSYCQCSKSMPGYKIHNRRLQSWIVIPRARTSKLIEDECDYLDIKWNKRRQTSKKVVKPNIDLKIKHVCLCISINLCTHFPLEGIGIDSRRLHSTIHLKILSRQLASTSFCNLKDILIEDFLCGFISIQYNITNTGK